MFNFVINFFEKKDCRFVKMGDLFGGRFGSFGVFRGSLFGGRDFFDDFFFIRLFEDLFELNIFSFGVIFFSNNNNNGGRGLIIEELLFDEEEEEGKDIGSDEEYIGLEN